MNKEETNKETKKHIEEVSKLLFRFAECLKQRAYQHDSSKLKEPELSGFCKYTDKLKGLTYGSEEYKQCLKEMQPFLDHHYKNNRHHPEHFQCGIADMNLIDIVEMFFDWWAATKRHADGDIRKSIEHNRKRFNISTELAMIFDNTVEYFEKLSSHGEPP